MKGRRRSVHGATSILDSGTRALMYDFACRGVDHVKSRREKDVLASYMRWYRVFFCRYGSKFPQRIACVDLTWRHTVLYGSLVQSRLSNSCQRSIKGDVLICLPGL